MLEKVPVAGIATAKPTMYMDVQVPPEAGC